MIETHGKMYLGRIHDPQTQQTSDQPILYDPDDLTTHAVVVGMTGSGKTGLCIDLMEEAALNNIPALMIDPKGDITNALLHFPDLAPSDFQPWISASDARRQGKSVEQAAAETAELWRSGLEKWGILPERIRTLQEESQYAIYTPGSTAGLQVSILATLAAPETSWAENQEMLREKISGTVTALLGLIGLKDIDPVRSREHILLANIFEHAWSQGIDLDLGELIMQTQTPPFEKLGVFDVNRFFPERDRFELAMSLNNILASPAFQTWIEGEPLDVARLMYDESGRPRQVIFYIAHLPETERMFFVTLLYSAIESWMRAQQGTDALRALVYFDEIAGYLPPVGNPPAKEPMMRMLKQARAFGVGMVLAAQNPADIDYKALSNAGTWFVGKLATEQDKERLLDGLSSAMTGGLDRREYDDLISSLGSRVFLLRNVHEKHPQLFQTRWAMNYLAGPMTRRQIPALNELAGAVPRQAISQPVSSAAAAASPPAVPAPIIKEDEPKEIEIGSRTRPAVPARISEFFLPNDLTFSEASKRHNRALPADAQPLNQLLYRPVLLAQAQIRFLNRKYDVNYDTIRTAIVHELDSRGMVSWEENLIGTIEARTMDREPISDSRFAELTAGLADAAVFRQVNTDFVDWLYRTVQVTVKANEQLGVYGGPEVSEGAFRRMCTDAAAEKAEIEVDKVEASYERKIDAIEKRLTREEVELRQDEAELSNRKREELGTHAETLLSLFSKRRRSVSSSLSKRRMTEKAKGDVEESVEAIAAFKQELTELTTAMADELAETRAKWSEVAADVSEIQVTPFKKDIAITMFGVAWLPYHLVDAGGYAEEVPGFSMG